MILTCPECNTRYTVPEEAFGKEGRMFRCANCKHSWFAASLESRDDSTNVQSTISTHDHIASNTEPTAAVSPVSYKPQRVSTLVPGPTFKAGKPKAISAFLAILIIILYPLANRNEVLKHYPELSGLFESLGIYDASGLALTDIKIVKTPVEDKAIRIQVTCNIVNASKDKRTLPPLTAFLMGNDKEISKIENLDETGNKLAGQDTAACKTFTFDVKDNKVDHIRLVLANNIDLALQPKK